MAYVSYKDQRYEMSFLTQKGELIKNNVGKYRYRNSDFKDSMMVIYHTDYPKEAFFRDLPFARNSPYSDSLVSALFLAIVIGYPIAYIITIINQLNSLKEEEKKI
ncbi:MAG: hypothetical protein EAZ97_06650 [Bacteroidetes bacterium]|nr:MAG: hypothetical protein EAZ97_06650 [Bacteroidota bacterium]